jgi:hypothetical protein
VFTPRTALKVPIDGIVLGRTERKRQKYHPGLIVLVMHALDDGYDDNDNNYCNTSSYDDTHLEENNQNMTKEVTSKARL